MVVFATEHKEIRITMLAPALPLSAIKTYETRAGPVLLERCCSPSFVQRLQADEGLHAFARAPEREQRLLLSIALRPENRVTLAYTANGKMVGQVTLATVNDWWQGIGNAYEIAVEVSSSWRQQGLAHHLLSFALEPAFLEDTIILGLGLSWHWDYEGLAMTRFRYRELIARLFAAHGFVEYLTLELNIRMDPANILVARLGSRVDSERIARFHDRLFQS
jgi:acetoin utilization protein AcuA